MKMYLITILVLLGSGLTVNSEKHSLMYIYTALSKPVGLPSMHEFTAMGLLDGKMIEYYDNDIQRKVPKQDWMKERLPADYWEEGKTFCLSKQQWFKVSIDILKKQMNQTDDDLHVLQWMHGCVGETEPNGTLKFVSRVKKFSYDLEYFLSFNNTSSVWVAATDIAAPNKRKWDEVQVLKENATGYLENKCIDSLDKFLIYRKKQLEKASPPDVHLFAKKTRNESELMLSCLATGFCLKDITLNIKKNGRIVTKEDGLFSSGSCPNEDNTFQRRDSVEVLKSDISSFACEVIHRASNVSKVLVTDGGICIIGGLIGASVLLVLVTVKWIIANCSSVPVNCCHIICCSHLSCRTGNCCNINPSLSSFQSGHSDTASTEAVHLNPAQPANNIQDNGSDNSSNGSN